MQRYNMNTQKTEKHGPPTITVKGNIGASPVPVNRDVKDGNNLRKE
jgi:hypothetical protein